MLEFKAVDFLVEKTERTVETAFLWLRILKALKRKPCYSSELRRLLNPMPHRKSFEASLFLMARLAIFATVYELLDHKLTEKNRLTCPHASYRLVIEQHVKGKLVGKLEVKTCTACDPGG